MRTTLNIDDDVLAVAKERARRESKTTGQFVSELLRRAMAQPVGEPTAHYGFLPFASRGVVVNKALIERLRNETGA